MALDWIPPDNQPQKWMPRAFHFEASVFEFFLDESMSVRSRGVGSITAKPPTPINVLATASVGVSFANRFVTINVTAVATVGVVSSTGELANGRYRR